MCRRDPRAWDCCSCSPGSWCCGSAYGLSLELRIEGRHPGPTCWVSSTSRRGNGRTSGQTSSTGGCRRCPGLSKRFSWQCRWRCHASRKAPLVLLNVLSLRGTDRVRTLPVAAIPHRTLLDGVRLAADPTVHASTTRLTSTTRRISSVRAASSSWAFSRPDAEVRSTGVAGRGPHSSSSARRSLQSSRFIRRGRCSCRSSLRSRSFACGSVASPLHTLASSWSAASCRPHCSFRHWPHTACSRCSIH